MSTDNRSQNRRGPRPIWFNVLLMLDAFALGGLAVWRFVLTFLESAMTGFITPSGEIFHVLDELFPYWLGHTAVSILLLFFTAGAYLWIRTGTRIGIALALIVPFILAGYIYLGRTILPARPAANPIQATPTPTGFAQETTPALKPGANLGWNTYQSARFGFVLDYPADWMLLVLPDTTHQAVTDQVWLSPGSIAFPRPGTDARPPLMIEITSQDPASEWKPEYFDNYQAKAYNLGQLQGTRISGVNKEGLDDELVILTRIGERYLAIYPAQNQDTVTQANVDNILATLRKD